MWEYEDGGEVITIYRPDGVGALTISAAHRTRPGEATLAEAIELAAHFAKQKGWDLNADNIESQVTNGAPSAHLSCRQAGDQWELWKILNRDRAVTITYVSNVSDADIERDAYEEIVGSFAWLPPTSAH